MQCMLLQSQALVETSRMAAIRWLSAVAMSMTLTWAIDSPTLDREGGSCREWSMASA